MNPEAWSILMAYIYPVMYADSYSMDMNDHHDQEIPAQAWEWDLLGDE